MLLTRECDYAVRIVRALSEGELVNVQDISEKEDISMQIIYKLARKMEKSGIIQSFRGVKGGYVLVADLKKLTLYDIFMSVDQKLCITECTNHDCICSRNSDELPCMVHKEFCRIQELVNRELKSRSILEIMQDE